MSGLVPLLLLAVVVAAVVVLVRLATGRPAIAAQSWRARLGFVVAGVVVVGIGLLLLR